MSKEQEEKQELLLQVSGLKKSFGGMDVLRGIDLEAYSSDVIAILGASGSGKSTFLRCLNFLETPDAGTMTLDGVNVNFDKERNSRGEVEVASKKILQFRARIGMVFQSFNLWSHLTAEENIMEVPVHVLGKSKQEARERALELLEKVSLYSHARHYPSQLSGGQKQRVAIARALAIDPKLILFDEPTSALDPELVYEVLGIIKDLAEEKLTMLIVSHEIGFSREVSNKTAFFYNGKIDIMGETEKVFNEKASEHLKYFLRHHK